jgi:hypothetical protein
MEDDAGAFSREAERKFKRAKELLEGSHESATALLHEARTADTVEKNLSTWKAFIAWAVLRGHAKDEAAYQAMEFNARLEVRLPARMRKRIHAPFPLTSSPNRARPRPSPYTRRSPASTRARCSTRLTAS